MFNERSVIDRIFKLSDHGLVNFLPMPLSEVVLSRGVHIICLWTLDSANFFGIEWKNWVDRSGVENSKSLVV